MIVQGAALLTDFMALYAKVSPLIGPVIREIDATMPAAQDLIAFVQKQQVSAAKPFVPSEITNMTDAGAASQG